MGHLDFLRRQVLRREHASKLWPLLIRFLRILGSGLIIGPWTDRWSLWRQMLAIAPNSPEALNDGDDVKGLRNRRSPFVDADFDGAVGTGSPPLGRDPQAAQR